MGSVDHPAGMRPRVLVCIVCETRAWEITGQPFLDQVLDPLGADLALCVSDRDEGNLLHERARYVWRLHEPDDWGELYDADAGGRHWRVLLGLDENLFGGVEDEDFPQIASGAIVLYFREFLRRCLEREGILDAYDWVIIARSDMLWPAPHVDLRLLDENRMYFLDGDRYGGVPDRHFILPRRFVWPFLAATEPIFHDPEALARRMQRRMAISGLGFMNVEMFLAWRLRELGLWGAIDYLPYTPYAVRLPDGPTRWSTGEFDEELGFFVKYPRERKRSNAAARFVPDQRAWASYRSPLRGAWRRTAIRWWNPGLRLVELRERAMVYQRVMRPFRRARIRWAEWRGTAPWS